MTSDIFLLLCGDPRAFLAEGFDRRLVLVFLLGRFFDRRRAILAEREGGPVSVRGIVGHLVLLVGRDLRRVVEMMVLILAHGSSLATTTDRPAGRFRRLIIPIDPKESRNAVCSYPLPFLPLVNAGRGGTDGARGRRRPHAAALPADAVAKGRDRAQGARDRRRRAGACRQGR